jgi:hypothetical protein
MGEVHFRAALATAWLSVAILCGAPCAAQAFAGHGYPPVVQREPPGGGAQGATNLDGDGRYDDAAGPGDGFSGVDDGVGYLPLSFFGDAGGVGAYAAEGGYSGGGYAYLVGGGSTGAAAQLSAHVSASVYVFGGAHTHGAGRSRCGCK